MEWFECLGYDAESRRKVVSSRLGFAIRRLENSVNPAVNGYLFSNQRKRRQRKETNGLRLKGEHILLIANTRSMFALLYQFWSYILSPENDLSQFTVAATLNVTGTSKFIARLTANQMLLSNFTSQND